MINIRIAIRPGANLSPNEKECFALWVMEQAEPVINRVFRRFLLPIAGSDCVCHTVFMAGKTSVSVDFRPLDLDQAIEKMAFESLALAVLRCRAAAAERHFKQVS